MKPTGLMHRRFQRAEHQSDCFSAKRRAISIVELIGAMVLLGIVVSTSITMLTVVARQRHGVEQRQFALQHATNLLERCTSLGWSRLVPGPQSIEPASDDLQTVLPRLERNVDVAEPPGEKSKLVTVVVRWQNRDGQAVLPVRLSAWVYPTEGDRTP